MLNYFKKNLLTSHPGCSVVCFTDNSLPKFHEIPERRLNQDHSESITIVTQPCNKKSHVIKHNLNESINHINIYKSST